MSDTRILLIMDLAQHREMAILSAKRVEIVEKFVDSFFLFQSFPISDFVAIIAFHHRRHITF